MVAVLRPDLFLTYASLTLALSPQTLATVPYGRQAQVARAGGGAVQHRQAIRDATYPTIVEIDLVFPRHNTTYKRTPYMPIVFAFQNFTAVNNFSYFFQWHLSDRKFRASVTGTLNHGVFNLSADSPAPPNPFLVVNHTGTALVERATSSRWILGYEFGYLASCNASEDGQLLGRVGPPITLLEGIVEFQVADNGTDPDVAAAGPCAGALGTFDVLGRVNATTAPPPFDWCPVLPDDASTTVTYGTLDQPEDGYEQEDIDPVDPCGVKVDADLARQVADVVARARCAETNNHTGDCASVNGAARGVMTSAWTVAAVAGMNALVIAKGAWTVL